MGDKSTLAISILYFFLFIVLGIISYALCLPLLPDDIWISTAIDSFLKSFLVALLPSSTLFVICLLTKKPSVGYSLAIIISTFIVICYSFAFAKRDEEYELLIPFINTFLLPFSILGTILSLFSSIIISGRGKNCDE